MTRFSTLLDKVIDRGQYVIWCDRRTLIAEEIDEHIRDGHKIWDLEFGGGPVSNCRRPQVALVCLHFVELHEPKFVTASPVCHSHVFVVGRQIGVGSFVALWSPMKARTLSW